MAEQASTYATTYDEAVLKLPGLIDYWPELELIGGDPRPDGLTGEEGHVMDALVQAVNAYGHLPVEHVSEPGDFATAIHRCQDLLAVRVARRHHPEGWPLRPAADG